MLVLDNQPARIRTTISWEDGIPVIHKIQDVRPVLEQNMREGADFDGAKVARNPGGFRHVARIPMVVIEQLRARGVIKGMTVVDEKAFMRFLSDREHYRLRTDNAAQLG